MLKLSTRILRNIKQYVFPQCCPICNTIDSAVTPLAPHNAGCCNPCLQAIHIFPASTCHQCGCAINPSLAPGPCGKCLQKTLPQQSTQSLYIYKGAVRDAVLAWKLQGQAAGLSWLLHTSSAQLQLIFSPDDILIPVPMPLYRMRRSGIHHSADLCKYIANIVGCDVDYSILRRIENSQRQSSLKGQARQKNLRKAFALDNDYKNKIDAYNIQGKVWVIDDILTTGATLRHACKAMVRSGYPVHAFALSRILHDL